MVLFLLSERSRSPGWAQTCCVTKAGLKLPILVLFTPTYGTC